MALPMKAKKAKKASALDILMGMTEEAEGNDESEDSDDADDSTDDEERQATPQASSVGSKAKPWSRGFAQGMDSETWLVLFGKRPKGFQQGCPAKRSKRLDDARCAEGARGA